MKTDLEKTNESYKKSLDILYAKLKTDEKRGEFVNDLLRFQWRMNKHY